MSIRVIFFGAAADLIGERELTVERNATTAGEFLKDILAKHPTLAASRLLMSVNQEYAAAGTPVSDGDEIAIFTLVSGG